MLTLAQTRMLNKFRSGKFVLSVKYSNGCNYVMVAFISPLSNGNPEDLIVIRKDTALALIDSGFLKPKGTTNGWTKYIYSGKEESND